ncbi:hypothetical protein N9195_01795 [bacterium]|nr:hypothetical protein [bacterium]
MKSLSCLLLSSIGVAQAGDGAKNVLPPPVAKNSGWSLRSASAGVAWRSLGSLDYRGSTRSQDFIIPSVVGGDSLTLPPIGSPGIPGIRTYENGFVNPDSTGSPDGNTWFWGYDSADQASGNDLRFNTTGFRSKFGQTGSYSGSNSDDKTLDSLSPQIDLVIAPPSTFRLPFDGILLSFWAFFDDSSNHFSNFSGNQVRNDYRMNYVDTFDIENISPIIGAPYAGSANGPGPVIPINPNDRSITETLIGNESAILSNSVSTSLDLDGYSLAVGPTWQGNIGSAWSWQASAGITLNIFSWSASETETLNYSLDGATSQELRSWRDSDSGNDFRVGVYAKGELIRQLNERWSIKASLQAEAADSVEMKVGDSVYEYKPRGFAVGLSTGYNF